MIRVLLDHGASPEAPFRGVVRRSGQIGLDLAGTDPERRPVGLRFDGSRGGVEPRFSALQLPQPLAHLGGAVACSTNRRIASNCCRAEGGRAASNRR
jgi:hypothetical protein